MLAVDEGIEKLREPHQITSPAVALIILGVALVSESFSCAPSSRRRVGTAALVWCRAAGARGELSWWRYVRGSTSPGLPVVLLEDLGRCSGWPSRSSASRWRR